MQIEKSVNSWMLTHNSNKQLVQNPSIAYRWSFRPTGKSRVHIRQSRSLFHNRNTISLKYLCISWKLLAESRFRLKSPSFAGPLHGRLVQQQYWIFWIWQPAMLHQFPQLHRSSYPVCWVPCPLPPQVHLTAHHFKLSTSQQVAQTVLLYTADSATSCTGAWSLEEISKPFSGFFFFFFTVDLFLLNCNLNRWWVAFKFRGTACRETWQQCEVSLNSVWKQL